MYSSKQDNRRLTICLASCVIAAEINARPHVSHKLDQNWFALVFINLFAGKDFCRFIAGVDSIEAKSKNQKKQLDKHSVVADQNVRMNGQQRTAKQI
jgi:hypothetical protein